MPFYRRFYGFFYGFLWFSMVFLRFFYGFLVFLGFSMVFLFLFGFLEASKKHSFGTPARGKKNTSSRRTRSFLSGKNHLDKPLFVGTSLSK